VTQALEPWLARNSLPDPFATESKEERGRVLVIGGTTMVPGAVWLAGRAALHAGAGKLQIATVQSAAIPLALRLPEAMVWPLPEDAEGGIAGSTPSVVAAAGKAQAVLIGPGMGDGQATRRIVAEVLGHARCPVVLDAGAIPAWDASEAHRAPLVVTPHAGEMAATLECDRATVEADPLGCARRLSERAKCHVVMKGVPTYLVDPQGNSLEFAVEAPGLGTSGSGDVLAGILAGVLARGASAATAMGWAVWLHGHAGARLGTRVGPVGYLARDISPEVPILMASVHAKDALSSGPDERADSRA